MLRSEAWLRSVPLGSARDGAVEQLGCDLKLDHRAGSQQDLSRAERLTASAGTSLELDRPIANQVLRNDEMTVHTRMHGADPMADSGPGGVDLHGQRVLVGDRDLDGAGRGGRGPIALGAGTRR